MKKIFLILILLPYLFSCTENEGPEKIIWVYPYKLDGPIHQFSKEGIFFHVLDSTELTYSPRYWERKSENFEIKGFDFEEGYFYKLLVQPRIKKNQQEAFFELKSILEKRKDYTDKIQGTWISIPLAEKPYKTTSMSISAISRTVRISSGCWDVSAVIGEVSEKRIDLLYELLRLDYDKLCTVRPDYDAETPDGDNILRNSTMYQLRSDGLLDFFDDQGNVAISFKPFE